MKKILVVDDEMTIADRAKRFLARAGIKAEVAYSVDQAMLKVKVDQEIVLVVSDVMMPQKTGWNLYEELITGGFDELADGVIFMAGAAPKSILDKIAKHCFFLLNKPIDWTEFVSLCKEELER